MFLARIHGYCSTTLNTNALFLSTIRRIASRPALVHMNLMVFAVSLLRFLQFSRICCCPCALSTSQHISFCSCSLYPPVLSAFLILSVPFYHDAFTLFIYSIFVQMILHLFFGASTWDNAYATRRMWFTASLSIRVRSAFAVPFGVVVIVL